MVGVENACNAGLDIVRRQEENEENENENSSENSTLDKTPETKTAKDVTNPAELKKAASRGKISAGASVAAKKTAEAVNFVSLSRVGSIRMPALL